MNNVTGDINFELDGGAIKMSLVKLERRDAGWVFHTILTKIAGQLATALAADKSEQVGALATALRGVEFETVETLLGVLCKSAIYNDKEIKSVDELDFLTEQPYLAYAIIIQGVKGNWPRLFFELGAKLDAFAPEVAVAAKTVLQDG